MYWELGEVLSRMKACATGEILQSYFVEMPIQRKPVALRRHCHLISVTQSFTTASERHVESPTPYTADTADLKA